MYLLIGLALLRANAVNKLKLTLSIGELRLQLQFVQSDFKNGNLFRTCSVATNLVTSFNISLRLLRYYALPFWPTREQFRFH